MAMVKVNVNVNVDPGQLARVVADGWWALKRRRFLRRTLENLAKGAAEGIYEPPAGA
jgi:hypothetical protein